MPTSGTLGLPAGRPRLLIWSITLVAAALVAPMAISAFAPGRGSGPRASRVPVPDLVELRPGAFGYRAAGEFSRAGKPVTAPIVTAVIRRILTVMRHQVTAADYQRCVEAEACPMVDRDATASDRPVVRVSWRDAQAYASWLSRETGVRFRLPTDEEWVYAAAGRFKDDALPDSLDLSDPGRRALAIYDRDASREEVIDRAPQPIGNFGVNENGLLDVAGNVWEWTDTCFVRSTLKGHGDVAATIANCGIRVVEGRHRTYLPDFIRDARAGGCSAGTPPSNLGFRLVRDDDPWRALRLVLARAHRLVGLRE
jgi:formylglycine-generating enzyme required for sulfatase activity